MEKPPVPVLVGIGKIGSSDVPTEAEVIEKTRLGIQAGDDVAQALAIGQLSEAKGKKLIIFCNPARGFAGGIFFNES